MKKLFLTASFLCLLSASANAHEGHDHGADESGGALSEIVLTDAMMTNLGIKTAPAELRDASRTVDMTANVDYLPERQAIISARTEGSVTEISVHPGQKVHKGEKIAIIQPRLIGNPPVTLNAPIDGFVTEQNVIIGQSITPDQPLVRIADLSEVLVRGQVYEDMAQHGMRVGQKVIVTIPALPGEIFEGTVHHIDATLQSGSRVREIDSLIPNPDGTLLANMQANLSVSVGDQTMALVVPQRAVLGDLGNYFVYVQEGDHFYRREVTLGQKFGPLREIIDGVLPDEQVVTVGNYQLQFITPPKEGGDKDEHGHSH